MTTSSDWTASRSCQRHVTPKLQVARPGALTFRHDHGWQCARASTAVFAAPIGTSSCLGADAAMTSGSRRHPQRHPMVEFRTGPLRERPVPRNALAMRYRAATTARSRSRVVGDRLGAGVPSWCRMPGSSATTDPASGIRSFPVAKAERCVTCWYFYGFDDEFWGPGFYVKVCAYFPYTGEGLPERSRALQAGSAPRPGSASPRCPTGSARCERPGRPCSGPATGSDRAEHLGDSPTSGWSRHPGTRSPPRTSRRTTGGSCRCGRSRYLRTMASATAPAAGAGRSSRPLIAGQPGHRPPGEGQGACSSADPRGARKNPSSGGTFRTAGRPPQRRRDHQRSPVRTRRPSVKQYLKDGSALRIETMVNSAATTSGSAKPLTNLAELHGPRSAAVNRRLLDAECSRPGTASTIVQPCADIASPARSSGTTGRPRGLRFGDPRVMALAWAPAAPSRCAPSPASRTATCGLARPASSGAPVQPANQTSYDLRRLSRNGLIDPDPAPQPYATRSPPTACGSRSSTPRSTTASCARSPAGDQPRLRADSGKPTTRTSTRYRTRPPASLPPYAACSYHPQ